VGRGPGALQRRIISELAGQWTKRLPWDELKRRFPEEVEQRTFYRAVRGLRRRGLVYDERGGTRHWLELTVLGDDEFLDSLRESIRLLEAAARARGATVPPIAGLASLSQELRSAGGRRPDVGA
jgi:DNA-binding transcriptional ArsR family regulator